MACNCARCTNDRKVANEKAMLKAVESQKISVSSHQISSSISLISGESFDSISFRLESSNETEPPLKKAKFKAPKAAQNSNNNQEMRQHFSREVEKTRDEMKIELLKLKKEVLRMKKEILELRVENLQPGQKRFRKI